MDGSDESEIAGIYLIGPDRIPYRVGFVLGNEFSDHKMERINYLYLAHSKLRCCSFGPELLTGGLPEDVRGTVKIKRNDEIIWQHDFLSGEKNMTHSISNLEMHHFKYEVFRNPGDLHLYFFGTSTMSFSFGIRVEEHDEIEIASELFGLPLKNRVIRKESPYVQVQPL